MFNGLIVVACVLAQPLRAEDFAASIICVKVLKGKGS